MRSYLLALATTIFFSCAEPAQEKNENEIFDGKTLSGWHVLGGTAEFTVADGMIVGTTKENTGNSFLCTEKEYSDFVFSLDFKIEDTMNNSGVMVRSHFDSTGSKKVYGRQVEIDPSSRRWSAGIYDEARREWLYPLTLNTNAQDAFKPDEFNSLKIECIANETKTWLNGKPVSFVVDTVDSQGFIALQVHSINDASHAGKKIYFKNIKLDTKPSATKFTEGIFVVNMQNNQLTDYETGDGWKPLFDGKTSNGWRSARSDKFPEKGWSVKNGEMSVLSSQGKESANGGDIITVEKYAAFDLSFSFKLDSGGNSGVKYFVTLQEKTDGSAIGLEYQLLDDSLHPDAKMGLAGNRTLASLYDLIKAEKQKRFIRPPGQWNNARIVVYPDNRVEHFLNGIKVLEYVRGSEEYRKLVAVSKYKIWPDFGEAKEGHILLQDHGDAVSFKNIKIKRL